MHIECVLIPDGQGKHIEGACLILMLVTLILCILRYQKLRES